MEQFNWVRIALCDLLLRLCESFDKLCGILCESMCSMFVCNNKEKLVMADLYVKCSLTIISTLLLQCGY